MRALGVEAFGLIGFYASLVAVLQVLDLGLSPTMNREMAKLSAQAGNAERMHDFSRTLEVVYWSLGISLGALVILLSRPIAEQWLNTRAVSDSEARFSIVMMGCLVAVQWPLSFYQSGLSGLQLQVKLNCVRIAAITLSHGGAVLAVSRFSPSVEVFFGWQILVMLGQVFAVRALMWRSLPHCTHVAQFDSKLLGQAFGFARGMTGIALFGAVLAQMDKAIVSRQQSLEMFGYYAIASTAAGALLLFVNPLFSAIFPQLSSLVVKGDQRGIARVYHFGTQLMACLIIPAALILAVFPREVLTAWTGDQASAANGGAVLALLAIGTAINGLMHLPYALQISNGWTELGFKLVVGKVAIFLPLLIFGVQRYGMVAAAAGWAALNLAYLIVGLPLTHRRLLKGEASVWILRDVGVPALAAIAVVSTAKLTWTGLLTEKGPFAEMAVLATLGLMASLTAMLVSPLVRERISMLVRHLVGRP